jgi:hypothetical protein
MIEFLSEFKLCDPDVVASAGNDNRFDVRMSFNQGREISTGTIGN